MSVWVDLQKIGVSFSEIRVVIFTVTNFGKADPTPPPLTPTPPQAAACSNPGVVTTTTIRVIESLADDVVVNRLLHKHFPNFVTQHHNLGGICTQSRVPTRSSKLRLTHFLPYNNEPAMRNADSAARLSESEDMFLVSKLW